MTTTTTTQQEPNEMNNGREQHEDNDDDKSKSSSSSSSSNNNNNNKASKNKNKTTLALNNATGSSISTDKNHHHNNLNSGEQPQLLNSTNSSSSKNKKKYYNSVPPTPHYFDDDKNASWFSYAPPATGGRWIRGVNLGGWLLLERYITPYQFAVTDCHVAGNYCWYPGQINAPAVHSDEYRACNATACAPIQVRSVAGKTDYPVDEYSLGLAFGMTAPQKEAAAAWLNYHFEHFVTREDLVALKAAGITHLRVPLPHWILGGDVAEQEPWWIVGDRWKYFVRMLSWARELRLQVWPDMHTAAGSQNGFDNSGQTLAAVTCRGWSGNPRHVSRQLQVVKDVTAAIAAAGYADVVTGFGLLNEPFKDCHRDVLLQYAENGRHAVRRNLGQAAAVYLSDVFVAESFNNGWWWLDPAEYNNTYLDSHYYQVFDQNSRSLSPRQHIAYVCETQRRDVSSCCYQDGPAGKTLPSAAVGRIVGEFSAAADVLVSSRLDDVMQEVKETGNAAATSFQRPPFTAARKEFLKLYTAAQMVTFELQEERTGTGWFYWNFKMEGRAFAEWDFLAGAAEGWIPDLPSAHESARSKYGSCHSILFQADDDPDILHEYPNPKTTTGLWQGPPIDDDVVLSHGDSLLPAEDRRYPRYHRGGWRHYYYHHRDQYYRDWLDFGLYGALSCVLAWLTWRIYCRASSASSSANGARRSGLLLHGEDKPLLDKRSESATKSVDSSSASSGNSHGSCCLDDDCGSADAAATDAGTITGMKHSLSQASTAEHSLGSKSDDVE